MEKFQVSLSSAIYHRELLDLKDRACNGKRLRCLEFIISFEIVDLAISLRSSIRRDSVTID